MSSRSKIPKIWIQVACLSIILAHFFSSFSFSNWFWGFNFLYFFSPFIRWLILIVAVLLCIPSVPRLIVRCIKSILCHPVLNHLPKVEKRIWWSLASVLSFPVFWTLRTKTHFLGDGYLRIGVLEHSEMVFKKAPLNLLIDSKAHEFLNFHFGFDGETSCALLTCLCGAAFVVGVFILADLLTRDLLERAFICGLLLSIGTIQLFFGYIEIYPLTAVAVLYYIIASVCYLRGRCSVLVPLSIFVLAFCLHLSAFCLVPSLIFLFLFVGRNTLRKDAMSKLIFISLGFLVIGYVVLSQLLVLLLKHFDNVDILGNVWYLIPQGLIYYIRNNALPLSKTGLKPGGYAVFSLIHLSNVMNELMLISPLAFILPFLFIRAGTRRLLKNDVIRFLMIVSGSLFLLNLIFNPRLGGARDWDIFAPAGVVYTILISVLLIEYLTSHPKVKSVAVLLLFTCVSHSLPWILVNASETKGVRRFERMLGAHPEWSDYARGYGHYILAGYYDKKGEFDKMVRELENALGFSNNPKYHAKLAQIYQRQGLYNQAVQVCKKALDVSPASQDVHHVLGVTYGLVGQYDKAEREFRRAIELNSRDAHSHNNLGALCYQKGLYADAIREFQKVLEIDPSHAEAYYNLGSLYYKMVSETQGMERSEREELAHKAKLHYEEFLKYWRGDPKRRKEVEAKIEHLEEFMRSR